MSPTPSVATRGAKSLATKWPAGAVQICLLGKRSPPHVLVWKTPVDNNVTKTRVTTCSWRHHHHSSHQKEDFIPRSSSKSLLKLKIGSFDDLCNWSKVWRQIPALLWCQPGGLTNSWPKPVCKTVFLTASLNQIVYLPPDQNPGKCQSPQEEKSGVGLGIQECDWRLQAELLRPLNNVKMRQRCHLSVTSGWLFRQQHKQSPAIWLVATSIHALPS